MGHEIWAKGKQWFYQLPIPNSNQAAEHDERRRLNSKAP